MNDEEADQFLGLIAENAQLKAEIVALQNYDRSIRSLERGILTVFVREAIGSDKPAPNINALIADVRSGVAVVESADSFKARMKGERMMKTCEQQRAKIAEIEQKTEVARGKHDDLNAAISDLEGKIEDHTRFIAEAQGIKDNFEKQIALINSAIEKKKSEKVEVTSKVARAQALGLELRRKIEQSKRNVSLLKLQGSES